MHVQFSLFYIKNSYINNFLTKFYVEFIMGLINSCDVLMCYLIKN